MRELTAAERRKQYEAQLLEEKGRLIREKHLTGDQAEQVAADLIAFRRKRQVRKAPQPIADLLASVMNTSGVPRP